jgi:hypothetical protein
VIGYRGTNNFDIDNGIISGLLRLFATDSGSSERQLFEGNPNGAVTLFHSPGGGAIAVARTLDDGAGGFEVNNQLTAAGFERVLTESDISAESGSFDGAMLGFTTSPVTQTFSYSRVLDLVTITANNNVNATSNAIFLTTSTLVLPASIRPAGERRGYFQVRNNGIVVEGSYQITVAGQILFGRTPEYIANAFTNSGSKGVQQFTLTYNINQS